MTLFDVARGPAVAALALLILSASSSANPFQASPPASPPPPPSAKSGVTAKPAAPRAARVRGFAPLNERLRTQTVAGGQTSDLKNRLALKSPALTGSTDKPMSRRGMSGGSSAADYLRGQGLTEQSIAALVALGMIPDPFAGGGAAPGDLLGGAGLGAGDDGGFGGAQGEGDDPLNEKPVKEITPPAEPPDSVQKLLVVGDLAFRKGLLPRAQMAYERALAMEPGSAACQLAVAEAFYASGQHQRAAESVYGALHRGPSSLRAMIDRTALYPSVPAMEKALSELAQFVTAHPDDQGAVLLYAYVTVTDGRDLNTARYAVQRAGVLLGPDPAVQALAAKVGVPKG